MMYTSFRRYGWNFCLFVMIVTSPYSFSGWDPTESDPQSVTQSQVNSREVIARFLKANPKLKVYFRNARGYALFPSVIKGGIVLGGAMGNGTLYERGRPVGNVSLKQMTFGLQLGGQSFSEIIFFKDKETIDIFKNGGVKFNAQASAVGGSDFGSSNLDYNDGIAIFTLANTGIMAEASLGGQHFKFEPF